MTAFKDWLNGLTSKTIPVDADELYVRDSSGTPGSKKLTWANLKATLLAYFDTAYLKLTGGTLAGGTVTASAPVLTTTQTWNNAAVTFSGKVTNITNTASAAASLIEDWQVGGVSKFNVSVLGAASVGDGGASPAPGVPGIAFIGAPQVGFRRVGTVGAMFTASGADIWFTAVPSIVLRSNGSYCFSSTSDPAAGADVSLYRDAAGTLAQRNGTEAQTFRLYKKYTDASNFERLVFSFPAANTAEIGLEALGTGALGRLNIRLPDQLSIFAGGDPNAYFNVAWRAVRISADAVFGFTPTSSAGAAGPDVSLFRAAASVLGVAGGSAGGAVQLTEMTAPAAPATNNARIYAEDNGAGKPRLMARFATGAAVQIAIEP